MKREKWKDIKGYEGVYQVSTFGRIKSLKFNKEKIFKKSLDKAGYVVTRLSMSGIAKTFHVHKLVAVTFLYHTPCGHKVVIDHINNDKTDNSLDNLQLISQRENLSKEQRGTSKYTGVSWDKRSKNWRSNIFINGIRKSLGRFDCELAAYRAYQKELNKQ